MLQLICSNSTNITNGTSGYSWSIKLIIIIYHFLVLTGYNKIKKISCANGSLAMYVILQKFCFLSHLQAADNNFSISGSPRTLKSNKNAICNRLFGCVSHTKTYPGIFDISVSICIAHQLIDISKFSVCHFHYIIKYNSA